MQKSACQMFSHKNNLSVLGVASVLAFKFRAGWFFNFSNIEFLSEIHFRYSHQIFCYRISSKITFSSQSKINLNDRYGEHAPIQNV